MALYRCYLLTSDGHVGSREDIENHSDGAAIARAREISAIRSEYPSFELWLLDRRIHAESRETAPHPTAARASRL